MNTDTIHDQLLQLLKLIFGTKVEILDQKIGNQLHDYLVLLIQLRRPSIKIVIKIAGSEAPMAISFERTAMLHHLVATQTSITMPEILAVNMSCQIWPWRYLIKTYIPGQEWIYVHQQMNAEDLANAYQQIGSAVAQLHGIQFQKFGELEVDGAVQGDKPFLMAFTERAQSSIKSEHLRDLFFSALDNQRRLFMDIRQARLCHEDLHGYNMLFQQRQGQWHLATILDFDKAWAGHHEIDLARLEFWRGMTSDEFWWSYKAICPIETLYEQRRYIYQLLWCFEYAQSTTEHIRDTQNLCAKLGLPGPDRF
jgi:fructosamine-3-kinase